MDDTCDQRSAAATELKAESFDHGLIRIQSCYTGLHPLECPGRDDADVLVPVFGRLLERWDGCFCTGPDGKQRPGASFRTLASRSFRPSVNAGTASLASGPNVNNALAAAARTEASESLSFLAMMRASSFAWGRGEPAVMVTTRASRRTSASLSSRAARSRGSTSFLSAPIPPRALMIAGRCLSSANRKSDTGSFGGDKEQRMVCGVKLTPHFRRSIRLPIVFLHSPRRLA